MSGLRKLAATVLAVSLATPPPALAQSTLNVVSMSYNVSKTLTESVARLAKPRKLTSASFPNLATKTPEQVIIGLCGSLQPGYYELFLAANRETLREVGLTGLPGNRPFDPKLASKLDDLIWPACLVIKPQPENSLRQKALNFGQYVFSATPFVPNLLPPPPPPPKLAGELIPKEGQGENLANAIAADSGAKVADKLKVEGKIVAGAPEGQITGGVAGSCASAHPPYDAALVTAAYARSRQMADGLRMNENTVSVYIFDNGFMGADPDAHPPFSPAFPAILFPNWSDKAGRVGPATTTTGPWPIIKPEHPDAVASHGTHVTGLVLGGPSLWAYRGRVLDSRNPLRPGETERSWLSLAIINLADGQAELKPGSYSNLQTLIAPQGTPRIINLSLAYNSDPEDVIKNTFANLAKTEHPHDLFVAAAGNDGVFVADQNVYPAALGGLGSPNVLTVAAHDDGAPSHLTTFSNRDEHADIAAPGCSVQSWKDIDPGHKLDLSGTSQAAPLVTFTAALLRSLGGVLEPQDLKTRILASGDLLAPADQDQIASHSKLNIAKAVLIFDDYVRLKTGEVFLGKARDMVGVRCVRDLATAADHSYTRVLAYKSALEAPAGEAANPANQPWYFLNGSPVMDHPCVADTSAFSKGAAGPRLKMDVTAKLENGAFVPPPAPSTYREFPLGDVAEFVKRGPIPLRQ